MGRPRNGEPYLKGGMYHVRFKGDKMPTDLGTKSMGTAKARVNEVIRMRARVGQASVSSPVPANPPASPSFGDNGIAGNGSPSSPALPGGPLEDWYRGESEFERTELPDSPSPRIVQSSPLPGTPEPPSLSVLPQVQQGLKIDWEASPGTASLSSDEKMRLHGLLASVVGRLNVLGVGLGVRIFGRIPAEPEAADMELLNKAWALQLAEMFADKEIKPAILIAAASVGLGVGMYVNGEDKPKPPATVPNV